MCHVYMCTIYTVCTYITFHCVFQFWNLHAKCNFFVFHFRSYESPINPTLHPYLRVTWIHNLGLMGSGSKCGGDTLMRVTTRWLTGLWSNQAKVEGIVLKAARQWGSDSSIVTIPLENHSAHRPSVHMGLHGWWPNVFSLFCGRAP
jgi:hypothetical protein